MVSFPETYIDALSVLYLGYEVLSDLKQSIAQILRYKVLKGVMVYSEGV